MKIKYQGVECLSGELNRTPGMAPGRGKVLILREKLKSLFVKYSPLGWIQGQPARWPEGERTQIPFSFGGTPPSPEAASDAAGSGAGVELNFFGDLVFDSSEDVGGSSSNVRTFRRIYIDRTGLEEIDMDAIDGEGKVAVVQVNLIDSRALWPLAGEVTGNFNVLAPGGGFDAFYLKEQVVAWKYEALLRMGIRALPTSPVLTFMHADAASKANPIGERPDHELAFSFVSRMLDFGGFTIGLHDDDTVGIYRENEAHTPFSFKEKGDSDAFTVSSEWGATVLQNVSYVPQAGLVRVIGDYRRQNKTSPMSPVFTDKTGKFRPLTDAALADAGMTLGGSPATISLLQSWVMAKPQNVKKLEPYEEKLIEDAYRLYMVSSAASLSDDGLKSWDFSKTTHPFLPILPRVNPPDATSALPFETPPKVMAVVYKQRMFQNQASLDEAITKFVSFIDEQSAEYLKYQIAAETALTNLLAQFKQIVANEETRTNDLITGLNQKLTFTEALVDVLTFGLADDGLNPDAPVDDTPSSDEAFANLVRSFSYKKKMYEDEAELWAGRIAQNTLKKATIESQKQKILDNHTFKEFFKRHFVFGLQEVPHGAYTISTEQGTVRFAEPMFIPEALVVQDLDSSKALPPTDAFVSIQYSYQFKGEAGMARVSWLFVNDPDNPGSPEMVGKNALCDAAPLPVFDGDLVEYLNDDGTTLSESFDDKMETAAVGAVANLFLVPRSNDGRTYTFAHFWKVAAIPPVTNIVVGTSGDTPQTFVAVNNPETPLLGYASQRQNSEAVNKVIRTEIRNEGVIKKTVYRKS